MLGNVPYLNGGLFDPSSFERRHASLTLPNDLMEPVAGAHDAAELRERLARLEKMLAHPQFAAMIARVERLEQIAERDHHALNVILQVLIDLGFISRDELKARLQKP